MRYNVGDQDSQQWPRLCIPNCHEVLDIKVSLSFQYLSGYEGPGLPQQLVFHDYNQADAGNELNRMFMNARSAVCVGRTLIVCLPGVWNPIRNA